MDTSAFPRHRWMKERAKRKEKRGELYMRGTAATGLAMPQRAYIVCGRRRGQRGAGKEINCQHVPKTDARSISWQIMQHQWGGRGGGGGQSLKLRGGNKIRHGSLL